MPHPWPSTLPPDAHWRYDEFFKHHWLRMQHCDIALVTPVAVGSGWIVGVNRHWDIKRRSVGGSAPSAEFGKKMVERWLWANLPRLRAEVDAKPRPRTLGCGPVDPTGPRRPYVPPTYPPPPTPEERVELERKEHRRRRGKGRRG